MRGIHHIILLLCCLLSIHFHDTNAQQDPCSAYSFGGCFSCLSAPSPLSCGWCSSTSSCESGSQLGPVQGGNTCEQLAAWSFGRCKDEDCGTVSDCVTCNSAPYNTTCGWCGASKTCGGATSSCATFLLVNQPQMCSVDQCNYYTTCSACSGAPYAYQCGWCQDTGVCSAGSYSGPTSVYCASSSWSFQSCGAAANCGLHTDCTDCTLDSTNQCGWCAQDGMCQTGYANGPYGSNQCPMSEWHFWSSGTDYCNAGGNDIDLNMTAQAALCCVCVAYLIFIIWSFSYLCRCCSCCMVSYGLDHYRLSHAYLRVFARRFLPYLILSATLSVLVFALSFNTYAEDTDNGISVGAFGITAPDYITDISSTWSCPSDLPTNMAIQCYTIMVGAYSAFSFGALAAVLLVTVLILSAMSLKTSSQYVFTIRMWKLLGLAATSLFVAQVMFAAGTFPLLYDQFDSSLNLSTSFYCFFSCWVVCLLLSSYMRTVIRRTPAGGFLSMLAPCQSGEHAHDDGGINHHGHNAYQPMYDPVIQQQVPQQQQQQPIVQSSRMSQPSSRARSSANSPAINAAAPPRAISQFHLNPSNHSPPGGPIHPVHAAPHPLNLNAPHPAEQPPHYSQWSTSSSSHSYAPFHPNMHAAAAAPNNNNNYGAYGAQQWPYHPAAYVPPPGFMLVPVSAAAPLASHSNAADASRPGQVVVAQPVFEHQLSGNAPIVVATPVRPSNQGANAQQAPH